MQKTATIFGGTGFIGRQIVKQLAQAGHKIKIATRAPESAYELKTQGDVGQITPIACDINDFDSITNAIEGSDYVINCIGILFETKRQTFARIHTDLPESIATASAIHKVERLIHISALGAGTAASKYAKSKYEGETKLLKAFPSATILRPSIVFGHDDSFFNRFAKLANKLPFLPLIGGGHTKFQPVYVGDVAKAAVTALTAPTQGKIYELGGSQTLSFKQLFELMFQYTNNPKPLLPLPFLVAEMQATIMEKLPNPMLTCDQLISLKTDNIVSEKALTIADLNIQPTALETILPDYLTYYRPGGRFAF